MYTMPIFDEEKQNKDLADIHRQEEEELVSFLAETKYILPYANLSNISIDNEALRYVAEDEARANNLAPFKLSGVNILIGIKTPEDGIMAKIANDVKASGLVANFYMVSQASLEKVWERYKELSMAEASRGGGIDISSDVLRTTAEQIKHIQDIESHMSQALEEGKLHKISRLLEVILAGAIAVKASDIHIEAEESRGRLRIRLDGVLQDISYLDRKVYDLLNSRIKLLSGLKLNSKTTQDGRFSISEGKEEINIRTSMIPGAYGESIVLRILDPKAIQIDIENMGMPKNLLKIVEQEIRKPNGMILLTGPTGSGKTTTLYAFIKKIYSTDINIVTIEDPIEYHLGGVTQTQVNKEKGYDFAEGMRSVLRQDPNIIMVGEIRDHATAETAINAALTGHMVFSTLHTNNAAGTIPRLIDLGVNPKIMVSALSMSIAQRLVRKLCDKCKRTEKPTEEEEKMITNILSEMIKQNKNPKDFGISEEKEIQIFKAVGCEECNNTGYKGRTGIFEGIKTDAEIEKIMIQNPSEREIKKVAQNQGILTLREDGIAKVLLGITSLEEVRNVVDLLEE